MASQNSLQNEVSRLMRDSEIRESIDPLRVLQRTREKNEELICLTLSLPLTKGLEQRIQLLLQQRKQVDVSYRIKMQIHLSNIRYKFNSVYLILYAIELIIQWFEFTERYGDYQWWSRQCWSQ